MPLPAPRKKLSTPESVYLVEVVKGMFLTISHVIKNILDQDRFRTIDYPDVWAATRAVMEGPPRHLIETLAEQVAAALLQRFTPVTAVVVEVTKPAPPVTFPFAGVAVRIRRERSAQA